MNILLFVPLLLARQIIEFPELERRNPDDICQEYQNNYVWKKTGECYTPGQDCTYGTHSKEDIEWTGKRVNFFRKLTGLSTIPLTQNSEFLNYVNQASLVMDKNNVFSHKLNDETLKCWTKAAQTGAANSNIYWSSGPACSTNSITSYIDDSNTDSLGHRRWILNPPLNQVVSGVAGSYSALLIMEEGVKNGKDTISKFLAYPPPGPVPSDLIFQFWSFSRNYTEPRSEEHNKMPDDTKVKIKCNDTVKTLTPSLQGSNSVMYPAMAKFSPGDVPAGTYCKVVVSSDSLDIEWRYTVLSIKCVNGKAENVNPDAFAGDDDGDGGYDFDDGKKGGGSSSNKDDDDDSEKSAKSLGNIEVKHAYLGTSPNVRLNLNFFVKLMKKVRLLFGAVVPAPEFVHSAVWVGQDASSDDSVGALFVYGKYWNRKNLNSYIGRDGAKAFVMTLREFKQRYPSIEPIKLDVNEKVKMFDFIEKVEKSGNWRASDYNWPTNNCQHFTAKVIEILKATRASPATNDWMDLPKQVLNSLKSNEKSLKKL